MTISGAQVDAAHVVTTDDLAPLHACDRLLDHGLIQLRWRALAAVAAGIRAAEPSAALRRVASLDGAVLRIGNWSADLDAVRSVVVLGAGKASVPIVAELERLLGNRLGRGVVVARRGSGGSTSVVERLDADHPIPTRASLIAGERLIAAANAVHPDDLVITAFTGGSSALASVPAPGISFEAKQDLHRLLVHSGASIAEINAVRKHASAIKGGRLAAMMNGARILSLTLSDVVGDHIDLICDPVVQDSSSSSDAIATLKRYELWNRVAPEIRDHLCGDNAESPVIDGSLDVTTVMLASGEQVVSEMAAQVRASGGQPVVIGSTLEGEAATVGGALASLASESSRHGRPFAPGAVMVGAGGETTVTIGDSGAAVSGGPNQEAAVAFARSIAGLGGTAAAAFVDSDGSDGGTDAAGGCIDSHTAAGAARLGVDLAAALAHHDTMRALAEVGDLISTGQTGTNISDIWAVAIGSADDQAVTTA